MLRRALVTGVLSMTVLASGCGGGGPTPVEGTSSSSDASSAPPPSADAASSGSPSVDLGVGPASDLAAASDMAVASSTSPVDMTGWTLAFDETFPGTSLDTTNWFTYGNGGSNTNEDWCDACIVVNDGLHLQIYQDSAGQWHGGGLEQHGSGYTSYRAEFRIKMPGNSQGIGPYLLMWPSNNSWPQGGEMDILETPGTGSKNDAMTTWHWAGANNVNDYDSVNTTVDLTQEHVFTIEKNVAKKSFAFWIDGKPQTVPASWGQNMISQSMVFGIGTAASTSAGWYGPAAQNGVWTQSHPFVADIDYVRIWTPQ